MGRFRRTLALALVATWGAVACQIIAGVEDEEGVARPDGSVADAGDSASDAAEGCARRLPPAPPSPESVPRDAPDHDYIFAIRAFSGRVKGQEVLGYDLDGRCTTADVTGSSLACSPPLGGKVDIDGEGGIDNALAHIIDGYALITDASDPVGAAANENIARGKYTNLIGLFGYNGAANDDSVKAQIVATAGLQSTGCDDAGEVGDGAPRWDGCDTWKYVKGKITRFDVTPVWQTVDGWVSNDVLVVPMDQLAFSLFVGDVPLYNAYFTARIDRTGGVVRLKDGIITGRAEAQAVVGGVRTLDFAGVTMCKVPTIFEAMRDAICKARDLPLLPTDDGKGKSCNAVSLAFGFEAELARLGVEGPTAPDSDCPEQDVTCPE
jgi:hypothetical protein